MKEHVKNIELEKRIFAVSPQNFTSLSVEMFQFQYFHNAIYRQYCDLLKADVRTIDTLQKIPFLPISFFKTHEVKTTAFDPEAVFESSGTSKKTLSRHFIRDISIYRKSFTGGFEKFYGSPENKCILALLPSYLKKKGSSLVMMVAELMEKTNNPLSGFFLYDHDKLHRIILHNELHQISTLLIGVTYALLDFAEKFPMQLRNTVVMETGGMKGKKEEMTRVQVHELLQSRLGVSLVNSEYGMTELLSQAYSRGNGIFHCPPWMKVMARHEDDPFAIVSSPAKKDHPVNGVLNIIDLANIYSCCFIASDDTGRLYSNGSFEVGGRLDNSDIRGCGLMVT